MAGDPGQLTLGGAFPRLFRPQVPSLQLSPPTPPPIATAPAGDPNQLLSPMMGANVNFVDVQAEMKRRISNMLRGAPQHVRDNIEATSAFRTREQQTAIYRDSDSGRKYMAARPGHSWHEQGGAVDWKFKTDAAREWAHQNAGNFGLDFPFQVRDPGHMQMAGYPLSPRTGMTAGADPSTGKAAFFTTYAPHAQKVGQILNVDPNTIMAHWANETGYGVSRISKELNNLAGIKDPKTGGYASYKSPDEFATAYADLLKNKYPGVMGAGTDVGAFNKGLLSGEGGRKYYEADPTQYQRNLESIAGTKPFGMYGQGIDPAAPTPTPKPTPDATAAKDPFGKMSAYQMLALAMGMMRPAAPVKFDAGVVGKMQPMDEGAPVRNVVGGEGGTWIAGRPERPRVGGQSNLAMRQV